MNDEQYIIGIDGGGTKSHAVLFNNHGETLGDIISSGSSLSIYKKDGIKTVLSLLKKLSEKTKINLGEISAIGIGIAGISDLDQRDILLNELDKLNISNISLVLSDVESAFELLCPTGVGVLVCIGTGIMCFGKNEDNLSLRIAGKGYDKGDCGSGYWIGKRAIKHILINQSIASIDNELVEIQEAIKYKLNIQNIDLLNNIIEDENTVVFQVASIAEEIINLAKLGNDIALSIIQEATTYVADYIIHLYNELNIKENSILISGHGSIIKNNFYRKLLNEALQFDFKNIQWVFSDISSAYGAGIIASRYKGLNVSIDKIVKKNKK